MEIKIMIDDRIVNFVKTYVNRRNALVAMALSAAIPAAIYARNSEDWFVFKKGDIIYADHVNANFSNLDGRVGAFESAMSVDTARNVGIGTAEPRADLMITRLDLRDSEALRLLADDGTVFGALAANGIDSGTQYLYDDDTITAQIGNRENEPTYVNSGNVGTTSSSRTTSSSPSRHMLTTFGGKCTFPPSLPLGTIKTGSRSWI